MGEQSPRLSGRASPGELGGATGVPSRQVLGLGPNPRPSGAKGGKGGGGGADETPSTARGRVAERLASPPPPTRRPSTPTRKRVRLGDALPVKEGARLGGFRAVSVTDPAATPPLDGAHGTGPAHPVNDPSAGSPTETLLRLLLPLDSQV